MPASTWPEDPELRAGFGYKTLTFDSDYDGPVTATLVRNEPVLEETGKPAILYLHGFIDYFFQKHVAWRFNAAGHNFYGLDLRKYGRSLRAARHPNICLAFEEYFPEITKALEIIADEGHTAVVLMALDRCASGGPVRKGWIQARLDHAHHLQQPISQDPPQGRGHPCRVGKAVALDTPRELCLKAMVEWAAVLVAAVFFLLAPAYARAQPPPCDRACLERALDGYMDALVRRQPARLRLAPSAKFTENGQRLELGDGLWRTITGRGRYALTITDVEAGQAVLMGTIRDADVPTVFVVRVKVAEERISEIETLVIRNQMAAESLDTIGAPRPLWTQPLPAAERASRAELVRVGNMYFSGIERNDGRGDYPIADNCARLENGVVTAGDPAAVVGTGKPAPTGRPRLGCRAQFETGMFYYVTRIRDRRFVVVDPERGLAFAFAFFDNGSGEARNGTLRDGTKLVSGPSIPWTWQIAEVFSIEKGLIVAVESVLHSVPYGMGSGWSTWEEAMSSLPRLG